MFNELQVLMTLRVLLASSVALCALTQGQHAFAQGGADGAQQQGGIEDIVVTARKRSESVQEIPVAVTAISAAQIQRYDLSSMERVAASIPQLTVGRNSSGSGAQITLRGIGTTPTSIGIEQSVATVVDGVYYGQGRIINEGFFDSQRIEVMKGPQALFYGKNATAGVISIVSADPGSEVEGLVRAGYEFRSQNVVGEVIASGPVSDTLGIRLALRGSKMFDGYFKNLAPAVTYNTRDAVTGLVTPHIALAGDREVPQEKEFMGRLTFKWQPTDRLTGTLKVSGTRTSNNNTAWNRPLYRCNNGVGQLNPAVVKCGQGFNIWQNDMPADIAETIPFGRNGGLYNQYRSWGVTANVTYELDNINFTSVSNYQWNRNRFVLDGDFQPAPIGGVWATESSKWHAFSTEFRALTDLEGPVNLMVGALYQKTKRDFVQYVVNAGAENNDAPSPIYRYIGTAKESATDGKTIAAFGQVIWEITPQWEATAGVRYTHETKDSNFVQPYIGLPLRALYRMGEVVAAEQSFNNWSPEATISYKPTSSINIFLAYKTAYKSGGFSNSGIYSQLGTFDDFTFDPETAKGFEGGIKSTILDNQLRLNLILYNFKYKNLQVDFFNSPTFAFITTNAGAAVTKGVEFEFQYSPISIPEFQLRGTLNYNKANYRNFIAPCYAGMTPAAGCSLLSPLGLPNQDLSGKPTAMSPRWTGSLGATYEVPVGGLKLGMSVDARYSDDYLTSSFANPITVQNAYVNLDASVRLRTEDDRWELSLIGKNLTNRFIATGTIDGASSGGGTGTATGFAADQVGLVAIPRTIQVQFTWRY